MNTKTRFDANSIRFRLWTYFMSFGCGIVLLIWFLQIFFLNNYYEDMKISEINRIGASIRHSFNGNEPGLTESIQSLSINNDYYVMMEHDGKVLLFSPETDSLLPVYRYKEELPKLKQLLFSSENASNAVSYKINSGLEKYSTLAYCCYLNNTPGQEIFLYIFSPLYPVSSTVQILKNQLSYITVITLLLAFTFAGYFAQKISKPIKGITSSAKKMGKGDYEVRFVGNSYSEINNLADALNAATLELGMIDTKQKDLIANLSHELKTPLTMIRSYAEMIRDLSGDNPDKRNSHLNVIIDEADRMTRLVSDMTTVSAIRTKKIVLNKSNFDLATMTASILASYEILEEQEGYSFILNSPKEANVWGDYDKIEQVIINLTGNAIKYCGLDKQVNVTIKRVGKRYRLEVSDHGPGISQEELPHIWERYYKTSTNYVRPTSGTGLGLSIVKEILTLHRANYGVDSKLGKGTTFWFELDVPAKDKT